MSETNSIYPDLWISDLDPGRSLCDRESVRMHGDRRAIASNELAIAD